MATWESKAFWLVSVLFDQGCGFDASRAQLSRIEMSVAAFELDCGRLPDSVDELLGAVRDNDVCRSRMEYDRNRLRGPYGDYVYYWKNGSGGGFHVRLLGKDRAFGSADDVTLEPEPHIWGGTLIEQREQRRAICLFALLTAVPVLQWLRLRRLRRAGVS